MKKTYRWGIIGAGNIAGKFASALNYTKYAELYAVASRDGGKGDQFGQKYGATRVYEGYHQLVEDPEVDIIYIATPHAFHCEQAILCLQHKKPVLSEKPMALSFDQVNLMVNTARSHNTFLMEGMWSRFMPSINKVLELIKEGIIGDVKHVRADFSFEAPFNPQGRLYDIKLGGGSLLDVGIYPLFLTTLLLGEPSVIQSLAKLAATGADEYCSMQFQYPGGQTASIFSGITFKSTLGASITGTKGIIYLQPPFYKATSLRLELHNGAGKEFTFPHEHNGFEYEIRQLMECLDKGDTECALMPHAFSLSMAKIMDTVREQCGIVY